MFYTRVELKALNTIFKDFQEYFDVTLEDTFSDQELESFEKKIDEMAAIFVQPILPDLSFDDFYPDPEKGEEQREFFKSCKTSISVENIPYFESNPFQVSYLKEFLSRLGEVLIDTGGINTLQFKAKYLNSLERFKDMSSLIPKEAPRPPVTSGNSIPVHPIDFLIRDVYLELKIATDSDKIAAVKVELESMPKSINIIFDVMTEIGLDSETLMLKSKLNPKDFGDQLERLKFFLRRINRG